ncbi:Fe(3+) dicitrate transport protein [Chitinophaga polysaccharea]|uniref:Fe(3+) dicitrate transport protein n=2 Tax=Chitinophaga polysaccharea TaxID=1293035 RepID=A0A561PP59_9BACT|nr:Fe(3+) dicitrate transport protein [Chitinophaga polysaccharea]
MRKLLSGLPFILLPVLVFAQRHTDSTRIYYLKDIQVKGIRTVRGTGHLPEESDGVIYAGKKNEVVEVDSLDANKAINNTRQILGRIPGLNITETETGGFTANGIATRGLNPTQSIEMNTRQNGYNISADIYGYNEAYYLPPMEAVSRVEMVRGAASLQFGSQFGGLVNYVLHTPPADKPFEYYTSQTAGSFGLFNTFHSFAGTIKKWSYYSFLQYRTLDGYRPNSHQQQFTGYGRLQYNASDKLNVGVEYSLLRNRIKMPGGLNDSMFHADPRSSFRARNWLKSPWNVITGYLNYDISPATTLHVKTTYLFSSRALVWRNEDGGPGVLDTIDPATGQYISREVQNEIMHNTTTEVRLLHHYQLGEMNNTLAGGIRYSYTWFKRQGGGEGTTASDFDLHVNGEYEYALDFTTTNVAPFIENIFRIGKKLSVTPGFRLEYLKNTAKGYITDGEKVFTNDRKSRSFPLFGLGAEYKTSSYTNVYANISQAYRPVDYSQLTPIGITSKIDPHMKDASGFNADLGYRGTVKNFLNFDIGLFYLAYNKRIGTVLLNDERGNPYTLRTNVANSIHKGVESYVELNILKWLYPAARKGISIFDAFGYTDAKYTSGEFKNNRVEAAAKYINRVGLIYSDPHFSATFQLNNVGDAYGDATNAKFSEDPIAGYIPAYTVMDVSATYKISRYTFKAGVNNLANKAYFTRRTDEYPGPGIIPSDGRSFYAGVAARF